MDWYFKLIIYLITLSISFVLVYQIDFNKLMRPGRKDLAIFLWLIISIVIGFLLGFFFIQLAEIVPN